MFRLTAAAAREVLAAAQRSQAEGMALRVAARTLADGSVEYGMGFDEERVDDVTTEFEGLQVLVGTPSRALLDGVELDFVEVEPGRFQFVFSAATPAAPTATDGDSA